MGKVTLYNKDARGQLRFWSIEIDYESCELIIQYGEVGGQAQTQTEEVMEGKQSRDIDEQLESRMDSRINKKIDRGYVRSIDIAEGKKTLTNSLGYPKPMLAQRIDKIKEVEYQNSFIQRKYDGHRCLITKKNGKIVAYSRNSKLIETIEHITSDIKIDEGVVLDGELYIHGLPLNTITSYIKRKQEKTKDLIFICYDIIMEEEYSIRYEYIKSLELGLSSKIAQTFTNMDESEIPKFLDKTISDGYEGLILRQPDYGYEAGKRSKGLVKIKKFLEDDYKVIGIDSSREGWAILLCEVETKNGKDSFSVSAPGAFPDKHYIWDHRGEYIGKTVNVKYANITSYGIPFNPVATRFVEEL